MARALGFTVGVDVWVSSDVVVLAGLIASGLFLFCPGGDWFSFSPCSGAWVFWLWTGVEYAVREARGLVGLAFISR